MQSTESMPMMEKREQSQLESILSSLACHNDAFIKGIHAFEALGHKLKDTNFPKDAKMGESPKPDGLLALITEQLDYYRLHIGRLEELYKKFTSII